jgi:hypothetical protein
MSTTTRRAILPRFVVELLTLIAKAFGFFPDAIAFTRAYVLGLQSPGFSKETKDQCHEALVTALKTRNSNGVSNKYDTITPQCKGDWYSTAAGVVGLYNVETIKFSTEGVHVTCKDTWDFNGVSTAIVIPLGKKLSTVLVTVINRLMKDELFSLSYDGEFMTRERLLKKFNGNAFSTTWEDFVTWEEIESSQDKWVTNGQSMWKKTRK